MQVSSVQSPPFSLHGNRVICYCTLAACVSADLTSQDIILTIEYVGVYAQVVCRELVTDGRLYCRSRIRISRLKGAERK